MPKAEISWKRTTPEGETVQCYAQHVGKQWIFYRREKRFDQWAEVQCPPLEDWLALLDSVQRRINRQLLRPESEARLRKIILERFPGTEKGRLEQRRQPGEPDGGSIMKRSPVILVTPSTERKGAEFADASVSLSNCYTDAVIAGGGLPQIFPATRSRAVIAEAVRRCDGVLMTGGDDIDPKLYARDLPGELAKTVGPLEPERDGWEKEVIAEVFAQRKPLFGICRGHQMLNVALGGTLVVDIATQLPNPLNHQRMDRKDEPVHDVKVVPDTLLAKLAGRQSFAVNSTHHQAIGELAPQLRAVAQSPDGVIEAVELKDAGRDPFLLGVQFHPERLIDRSAVFRQLFSGFVEACACGREKNL